MHSVIEMPAYLTAAKHAGVTETERENIVLLVSSNPNCGDPIVGTGGARKVRVAKEGGGKSGGYRVITFYSGLDVPVFLLDLFAKGDKVNLTKGERNDLAEGLEGLVADYRSNVKLEAAARAERKGTGG